MTSTRIAQPSTPLTADDVERATAAVDRISEAFSSRVVGQERIRTALLVTNRPATLALADSIVVLQDGRVIDRGTAAELRERCPLFRDLTELGAEYAPSLALAAREEEGL